MQNLINYYRFLFKDNAQWFKVVLVWFIVTALAGAITFVYYPSLVGKIIAGFQEKFGRSPALDINLALQIFIQNVIASGVDRKSTRLNSSHQIISYAVFCLKKKRFKVCQE